jgi:hypothetical protein
MDVRPYLSLHAVALPHTSESLTCPFLRRNGESPIFSPSDPKKRVSRLSSDEVRSHKRCRRSGENPLTLVGRAHPATEYNSIQYAKDMLGMGPEILPARNSVFLN